ncbi:hypothetical protein C2G38_2068577, partial [Gigaspora rosea]
MSKFLTKKFFSIMLFVMLFFVLTNAVRNDLKKRFVVLRVKILINARLLINEMKENLVYHMEVATHARLRNS